MSPQSTIPASSSGDALEETQGTEDMGWAVGRLFRAAASSAKERWGPSPNLPAHPDPSQYSTPAPHPSWPVFSKPFTISTLFPQQVMMGIICNYFKQEKATLPRLSSSREFFFKENKKGERAPLIYLKRNHSFVGTMGGTPPSSTGSDSALF